MNFSDYIYHLLGDVKCQEEVENFDDINREEFLERDVKLVTISSISFGQMIRYEICIFKPSKNC